MKRFIFIVGVAIAGIAVSGFQSQAPRQIIWTDRGGTVTLGGTSQQLMAANPARQRLMVQNPCSTTSQGVTSENLFINFEGVASSTSNGKSIELQACGSYDSGGGPVSTGVVTINAATTGHQFMAKEGQ